MPSPNAAAPKPPTAAPPARPMLRAVGKAEAPALAPSSAPPAAAATPLPRGGSVCVPASDRPARSAPPAPRPAPLLLGSLLRAPGRPPLRRPGLLRRLRLSRDLGRLGRGLLRRELLYVGCCCSLDLLRALPGPDDELLGVCWPADDSRQHSLLHLRCSSLSVAESKALHSLSDSRGAAAMMASPPRSAALPSLPLTLLLGAAGGGLGALKSSRRKASSGPLSLSVSGPGPKKLGRLICGKGLPW